MSLKINNIISDSSLNVSCITHFNNDIYSSSSFIFNSSNLLINSSGLFFNNTSHISNYGMNNCSLSSIDMTNPLKLPYYSSKLTDSNGNTATAIIGCQPYNGVSVAGIQLTTYGNQVQLSPNDIQFKDSTNKIGLYTRNGFNLVTDFSYNITLYSNGLKLNDISNNVSSVFDTSSIHFIDNNNNKIGVYNRNGFSLETNSSYNIVLDSNGLKLNDISNNVSTVFDTSSIITNNNFTINTSSNELIIDPNTKLNAGESVGNNGNILISTGTGIKWTSGIQSGVFTLEVDSSNGTVTFPLSYDVNIIPPVQATPILIGGGAYITITEIRNDSFDWISNIPITSVSWFVFMP